jgi:transcriptional regulator with XRE-family HTH domain
LEKTQAIFLSNLKRLLEIKRVSVLELSKRSGITRSGLYKILDGQRWPSSANLDRICSALGITPGDLFGPPQAKPDLGIPRDLLSRLISASDEELEKLRRTLKIVSKS